MEELKREKARKWYHDNKEKAKERIRRWNCEHIEERRAYLKEYRKTHQEKRKEWYKTPIGRASYLVSDYKQFDKICGRPEGDLTPEWVVENIFTKPCAHCGETDWHKLGCNRIDNSKSHTKDNVETCCWKCNTQLARKIQGKKVYQYTLDDKLVTEWDTTGECGRNGFCQSAVAACCRNNFHKEGNNIYKGYKWSYTPL